MVSHGISGAYHMGHLMKGGACIDAHLHIGQAEQTGIVQSRIDEHGYRTENHDSGNGHGGLVRLRLHDRFCPEHSSGPANGTARGSEQGKVLVHLEKTAEKNAEKNGDGDDDKVNDDGGKPHLNHALKSQPEAVKDDSQTQNLFRTELNPRHPGLRKIVPQRIGIEHSQNDAHNQRTEGKLLDKFKISNVKRRTRKKRYQQHPMQHTLSCLRCHIQIFKRAAKIVKLYESQRKSMDLTLSAAPDHIGITQLTTTYSD